MATNRGHGLRRALALSLLSLGWSSAVGVIAVGEAVSSGALALLGFGVTALIDAFASSAPTPGGGSAAAMAGAMSASLLRMVATMTKTKSGTADERAALDAALDAARDAAAAAALRVGAPVARTATTTISRGVAA